MNIATETSNQSSPVEQEKKPFPWSAFLWLAITPMLGWWIITLLPLRRESGWFTIAVGALLTVCVVLALKALQRTSRWSRPDVAEHASRSELAGLIDHPEEKWYELLKLEYDKAADRYENIYKAIWQNFYYSAVIGAAILTFGASQLRLDLVGVLALSPLLFWLVATYLPMNHYGEEGRRRLSGIERDFNDLFFANQPSTRADGSPVAKDDLVCFRHFTRFGNARPPWRVAYVIYATGIVVGVLWLALVADVLTKHDSPLQLKREDTAQLTDSITHLKVRGDSLAAVIRNQRLLLDSLQRPHR